MRLFAEECIARGTDEPVMRGEAFYARYRRWAQDNGHRNLLSSNKFVDRIEKLNMGIKRKRLAAGSFWNVEITR